MPIIKCPNCGDRMQVDPSDLGERVICPGCDHRFAAQDDSGDERSQSRGRDAEERRPRSRSRDDDFDRPRKKKSNALLYIILGLVAVFVVLPCVGCIGFGIYVDKAKQSFGGTWTDHPVISLDGGAAPVTASFPIAPVSGSLNDAGNSGTGATLCFSNMDQNDSIKDATFLIGYVDYPAGTTNPLDKCYLTIRSEIAEQHLYNPLVPPHVVSETPTTVGGYPAKEARYAKDDGDFVLRVIHVNDRPKSGPARLVVVLAGGTGMKEEDKQKFLSSVKIGKGK